MDFEICHQNFKMILATCTIIKSNILKALRIFQKKYDIDFAHRISAPLKQCADLIYILEQTILHYDVFFLCLNHGIRIFWSVSST